MLLSCWDFDAIDAPSRLAVAGSRELAVAFAAVQQMTRAWRRLPAWDERAADRVARSADAPSGTSRDRRGAADGLGPPAMVLRGMTKRPRYSRNRVNCGLPVASAMARWKAKSSLDRGSRRAGWRLRSRRSRVDDLRELRRRRALGRQSRGLDLDRRSAAPSRRALRAAMRASSRSIRNGRRGIVRDEGADALARDDQAFRAQSRDRLAHDGAADAGRGDHLLLGRQPRAGRELAARRCRRSAARRVRAVRLRGAASGGTRPSFSVAALFSDLDTAPIP